MASNAKGLKETGDRFGILSALFPKMGCDGIWGEG